MGNELSRPEAGERLPKNESSPQPIRAEVPNSTQENERDADMEAYRARSNEHGPSSSCRMRPQWKDPCTIRSDNTNANYESHSTTSKKPADAFKTPETRKQATATLPTPRSTGTSKQKTAISQRIPPTPTKTTRPIRVDPHTTPTKQTDVPVQLRTPPSTSHRVSKPRGRARPRYGTSELSDYELKRLSRFIVTKLDWTYAAEYVASNRRPKVYRKAVTDILEMFVNARAAVEGDSGSDVD